MENLIQTTNANSVADAKTAEDRAAEIKLAEARVIELETVKFEVIKPFYEKYEKALKDLHELVGEGYYFQDDAGIVYKTVEPDGTFVKYQRCGIARTRFVGEEKGSLSMKEAREAGYVVEGK